MTETERHSINRKPHFQGPADQLTMVTNVEASCEAASTQTLVRGSRKPVQPAHMQTGPPPTHAHATCGRKGPCCTTGITRGKLCRLAHLWSDSEVFTL